QTPVAGAGTLQVNRVGLTGGAPANSGTTDPNQIATFAGNGGAALRVGMYTGGAVWLQPSLLSNYGANT
ncbi:hypothetical protein, partial [Enterobacter bugandensis]|uniref:hypothetical protein n=1 Tax=Enterobacter bugandensis TaxID=881260 RepID=UPI0019549A77